MAKRSHKQTGHIKGRQKEKLVPKPPWMQLSELANALQILSASLQKVRQDPMPFVIVLAGQLRSLLAEKTKDSSSLLLDIAEQNGIALPLFVMPMGPLPPGLPEPEFWFIGEFASIERKYPAQTPSTLADVLEHHVLRHNGATYTAREVLRWHANKAGGSHYARSVPEEFLVLQQVAFGANTPTERVVVHLAEIALPLGVRILRQICELEIQLLIAARDLPTKEAILLQGVIPGTPQGWQYSLLPSGALRFTIRDALSVVHATDSAPLDWSTLHHAVARYEVDTEATAILHLTIDTTITTSTPCARTLIMEGAAAPYAVVANPEYETSSFAFAIGGGGQARWRGKASSAYTDEMERRRVDPTTPLLRLGLGKGAKLIAGPDVVALGAPIELVSAANFLAE